MPGDSKRPTSLGTKTCPGCGKGGVSRGWFACRRCWFALPIEIRDDFRHGQVHNLRLLKRAQGEALEWFAAHRMVRS